MGQFFASLPSRVIAIGAIILGLVALLIYDPPKTICDSQLSVFVQSQGGFLFSSNKNGISRQAIISKELQNCRNSAGPGGCFVLFEKLRKLVVDLENIPSQCAADAGELRAINAAIWESLRLFVQLAWGEQPPAAYTQRYGWLDSGDVALFCGLKKQAIAIYGREAWLAFRNNIRTDLPKASTLPAEQVWQRSLISASCENYR